MLHGTLIQLQDRYLDEFTHWQPPWHLMVSLMDINTRLALEQTGIICIQNDVDKIIPY